MLRRLMLLGSLILLCTCVRAQRVLLFEKLTSSKSERLYEGDPIRFKMKGDKFWQSGGMRELRPDIQAIVIGDRFIMLDEIAEVHQGKTFGAAAGYSLMTFGVAWSGIGLVGYATDKDPTTRYETRDLLVTLTTVGTGYLINKLLGQKRFRTGKYRRLRIVDTSF